MVNYLEGKHDEGSLMCRCTSSWILEERMTGNLPREGICIPCFILKGFLGQDATPFVHSTVLLVDW